MSAIVLPPNARRSTPRAPWAAACHQPPNCQRSMGPDLVERPHDLSITQSRASDPDSSARSASLDAIPGGRQISVAQPSRIARRCACSGNRLDFLNQRCLMQSGRCNCPNSLIGSTLRLVPKPFMDSAVSPPAHQESGCTILFGNDLPEHRVTWKRQQFFRGDHDVPDCLPVDPAGRDSAASGRLPSRARRGVRRVVQHTQETRPSSRQVTQKRNEFRST